MSFDDLLPNVGDKDQYQQLMLLLVFLPSQMPYGVQFYGQLFTSITPDYWCRVPMADHHPEAYHGFRWSMVREYKNWEYLHAQCFINESLNDAILHSMTQTKVNVVDGAKKSVVHPCWDGWYYNKSWLADSDTIVSQWDLVCDRSWLTTLALAMFGIGEFLSLPLYFYVTYRHGKRFSFFLFLATQCLLGTLSAVSPNVVCFSLLRLLIGLTVPATTASPTSLAQELVGFKFRGWTIQLCYLFRCLGGVLLAGSVFVIRDWPQIALASSIPFVAFFLYWCWFRFARVLCQKGIRHAEPTPTIFRGSPTPVTYEIKPPNYGSVQKRERAGYTPDGAKSRDFHESPRWLLARGRFEETLRLLRTIAEVNKKDLTSDYLVSMKRRFQLERSLSCYRSKPQTQFEATMDLFRPPAFRKRTTVIIFCWLTSTASFLGLNYFCLELHGDVYLNFLLSAISEVIGWVVAATMLRCCSRRCSYCVSCALGGVLCVTMATRKRGAPKAYFLASTLDGKITLTREALSLFTALGGKSASLTLFVSTKLSVSISYYVLPLWTAELLPDPLRETALHVAEMLTLACPFLLPLLMYQGRTIHSLPMILIGVLQLMGGLAALGLPETRLTNFLKPPPLGLEGQCENPWSCCEESKIDPRNGILRNRCPNPPSPIFSLLRSQESQQTLARRDSALSELGSGNPIGRHLSMDELKVTVL